MKTSELIFKEVETLPEKHQRKVYKYAHALHGQNMKITPFIVVAIALHLAVLFGITLSAPKSSAAKEEKQYVEVTLTIEQPPDPPPPQPLVEHNSDVPNHVAGPADQANSVAAPGPKVDDLPPPVDQITPDVESPPPSPTPPTPDAPPSTAPPTAPSPLPNSMALPIGRRSPNINAASRVGNGRAALSGAPVSGTGQGGGGVQWSKGKGGNGHYYEAFYVARGIDWDSAQEFAQKHGGYLATITSAAENNFVFSLINDAKYWQRGSRGVSDGPWIGGHLAVGGRGKPDIWEWVNNEGPFKFSRWAPGEPDNLGGDQHALHYYNSNFPQRSATWDDLDSGEPVLGFVVEYDIDPAAIKAAAAASAAAAANTAPATASGEN